MGCSLRAEVLLPVAERTLRYVLLDRLLSCVLLDLLVLVLQFRVLCFLLVLLLTLCFSALDSLYVLRYPLRGWVGACRCIALSAVAVVAVVAFGVVTVVAAALVLFFLSLRLDQ